MESGLEPSRLELEVTEGLLIDNTEEVTYALRELKGMGVSVALDDFGTGYSSLSYLLKFPFDKLKIDRSFISAIEGDEVARNVLEAIAKLGNVLDLKVTAEGVETQDQVDALESIQLHAFPGLPVWQAADSGRPARALLDVRKSDSETWAKIVSSSRRKRLTSEAISKKRRLIEPAASSGLGSRSQIIAAFIGNDGNFAFQRRIIGGNVRFFLRPTLKIADLVQVCLLIALLRQSASRHWRTALSSSGAASNELKGIISLSPLGRTSPIMIKTMGPSSSGFVPFADEFMSLVLPVCPIP